MQLIDTTCAHCGAQLTIDKENNRAFCKYCGSEFIIEQQNQSIDDDNAERIGYQFEKGRQRAQNENMYQHNENMYQNNANVNLPPPPPRKRHIFWWVMGWIFIFPIPATILVARNKNIKPQIKALIIIAVWVVYFLIGVLSRNS